MIHNSGEISYEEMTENDEFYGSGVRTKGRSLRKGENHCPRVCGQVANHGTSQARALPEAENSYDNHDQDQDHAHNSSACN